VELQPQRSAPDASRIRYVPYSEAYAPGFEDMRRRVPDISKINRYTGWSPQRNLDTILSDVIASFGLRERAVAA
jgi:UDP-glucose 4-epimerase